MKSVYLKIVGVRNYVLFDNVSDDVYESVFSNLEFKLEEYSIIESMIYDLVVDEIEKS